MEPDLLLAILMTKIWLGFIKNYPVPIYAQIFFINEFSFTTDFFEQTIFFFNLTYKQIPKANKQLPSNIERKYLNIVTEIPRTEMAIVAELSIVNAII